MSVYWIYENWRAESKAVIHRSGCSFCNDGKGIHSKEDERTNDRWHGPFSTYAEVYERALSLRREIRDCGFCNPRPSERSSQHAMVDESEIIRRLKGKCFLDCGCGKGGWADLISKPDRVVVGFDVCRQRLEEAKVNPIGCYASLVRASMNHIPFGDRTFDTSLAVEIIEHGKKEDGRKFLRELKRITRSRVILTSPQGLMPLDRGEGHPETHKSGWSRRELENEGFRYVKTMISKYGECLLYVYDA